jgi:uncharacterized surface protein with fasciclin (FAS1) repeats
MKNSISILGIGAITLGIAAFTVSTPTYAKENERRIKPTAAITSPINGSIVEPNFTITVDTGATKKVKYVEAFLTSDEGYRSLGVDTTSPYNFAVTATPGVKYKIWTRTVADNFSTSKYAKSSVEVKYSTIVDAALATPDLSTLVAAASAAGLVEALSADNLTVLAPTNDAFNLLGQETINTVLKPENKAVLTKILTYHVLAGKIELEELETGSSVTTLQGQQLTVINDGHTVSLKTTSGQTVGVIGNVSNLVKNGNVYLLEKVLLPN